MDEDEEKKIGEDVSTSRDGEQDRDLVTVIKHDTNITNTVIHGQY